MHKLRIYNKKTDEKLYLKKCCYEGTMDLCPKAEKGLFLCRKSTSKITQATSLLIKFEIRATESSRLSLF